MDKNNKQLARYMRNLIKDIQTAQKSNEEIDWITLFAQEFISVHGKQEAQNQIRAMKKNTETEKEFCGIVANMLKNY